MKTFKLALLLSLLPFSAYGNSIMPLSEVRANANNNVLELKVRATGVSGCRKGRKPPADYITRVGIRGMEVGQIEFFQMFAAVPVRKQSRCLVKCEFVVEKTSPNNVSTFPSLIFCNAVNNNDWLSRLDFVSDLPDTNIWREVTLHSDWKS